MAGDDGEWLQQMLLDDAPVPANAEAANADEANAEHPAPAAERAAGLQRRQAVVRLFA